MRALTAAWTERHTAVALAITVSIAAQLAALVDREPVAWWVAGALGGTAVGALAFDAWGGSLVGLCAAVGLVALRRATDHWTPDLFWPAAVETLSCVLLGACCGAAGSRLRHRTGPVSRFSHTEPAHGSMGLIGPETAMERLEEELARGRRLHRPVALVLLDVDVLDPSLSGEGRQAAFRAFARLLESRAQEQDVPFALERDRLGVICPETSPAAVWDMVGRILESMVTATFAFGTERTPHGLSEAIEVTAGISHQSERRQRAEDLLDDALGAVARARADAPGGFP